MLRDLMSGALDLCKSSTTTTAAPGHWSSGARAWRLPDYYRQGQASCSSGAATVVHRRLVLATLMVVRWSRNLDVHLYYVWDALYF